jgi:hypothetical protein
LQSLIHSRIQLGPEIIVIAQGGIFSIHGTEKPSEEAGDLAPQVPRILVLGKIPLRWNRNCNRLGRWRALPAPPFGYRQTMLKRAKRGFEFVAASYLVRIRPERAWTIGELAQNLSKVSDASIFYHTFQSLESHHYTLFSNDFAQWVTASCNEAVLAEELAAIDLRDINSIEELRHSLVSAVEHYLSSNPQVADRPAYQPFYFCEAIEVIVSLDSQAYTLQELAAGIRQLSLHTLHHYFITSRLREPLQINDFSHWIGDDLELPELAAKLNGIDFYMNTLDGVRKEILQTIEPWIQ